MKKHKHPHDTPHAGGGGTPHQVDEQPEENWKCDLRNRKHSIKDHRRFVDDKRKWTWSE